VTIAFADLVGFTRLGEEVPAEQAGAVGRRSASSRGMWPRRPSAS